MSNPDLSTAPKYLRATPSRGISEDQPKPVDPKGGRYSAGLIRGVSVITVGEALGHHMWVDETMLEQVAEHINRPNKGVKSRYTHPSLSGDGLGRHTSRVSDAVVDGEQVFADQHFLESAHDTPEGDLAGYLLNLAAEDPEAYGLSIVFKHDQQAMIDFAVEHGAKVFEGLSGEPFVDWSTFESPDPRNVNNYPHARVAEVRAADAVDEPAANPGGLFSREQAIAEEADQLAAYALGLSTERPEMAALSLDPDRVRGFASRFLASHNLEVTAMQSKLQITEHTPPQLEDEQKPEEAEATTPPAEEPAEPEATEEPPAEEASEPGTVDTGEQLGARDEFKRFREAFGDRAADYYAAGLSFSDAQARHNVLLGEENAKLKQQIAALGAADGEAAPVNLNPEPGDSKQSGFAGKLRIRG